MSRYAVAAVGADRPGIVAAVSGVLVERGCNLHDTAMSLLGGCFAMMLVVEAGEGLAGDDLESALRPVASELDLIVMVRAIETPVEEPGTAGEITPESRWTVSVYGADRPGIVHGVARLLADHRINIVDLSTRAGGSPDSPVYGMLLEVDLPEGFQPRTLGIDLERLATELGISASLHPSEADIL